MLKLFVGVLLNIVLLLNNHVIGVTFNAQYQLSLVNSVRSQNGKGPLSLSPCLVQSAQAQSSYQASINTMTHTSPYGDLFQRMQAFSISSMTSAAENVAYNYQSDDAVVAAWTASSGHFANMIGNYQYFGAGMVTSSNGSPYWTQHFANYGSCSASSSASTTLSPTTSTTTAGSTTTGTPSSTTTTSSTTGTPSGSNLSNVTNHLALINSFRAQNGKSPLSLSPCLVQASLSHSQYQASINTMTNSNPAGGIIARIKAAGATTVTSAAQNVGGGYNTDSSAVTGFTTSSTQNNILGNYQYFGVAMVKSSSGYPYWTQIFMNGSC